MGLSEETCLRIRIFLYVVFGISYCVGAVIFILQFQNHLAAFGFAVSCLFIAMATVLHIISPTKLNGLLSPGSKARIAFQSAALIITLAFVGAAIYALVQGIRLRQAWRGDSYFCSLVALLTAGKWCFFCACRVKTAGNISVVEEDCGLDEKTSLFEPPQGVWDEGKKLDA